MRAPALYRPDQAANEPQGQTQQQQPQQQQQQHQQQPQQHQQPQQQPHQPQAQPQAQQAQPQQQQQLIQASPLPVNAHHKPVAQVPVPVPLPVPPTTAGLAHKQAAWHPAQPQPADGRAAAYVGLVAVQASGRPPPGTGAPGGTGVGGPGGGGPHEELDVSDCSCSNSLECLTSASQHSPPLTSHLEPAYQAHLAQRQSAAGHQRHVRQAPPAPQPGVGVDSTCAFSMQQAQAQQQVPSHHRQQIRQQPFHDQHRPLMAHSSVPPYGSATSHQHQQQHQVQRHPQHQPPLIRQATYTATPDTITDGSIMGGVAATMGGVAVPDQLPRTVPPPPNLPAADGHQLLAAAATCNGHFMPAAASISEPLQSSPAQLKSKAIEANYLASSSLGGHGRRHQQQMAGGKQQQQQRPSVSFRRSQTADAAEAGHQQRGQHAQLAQAPSEPSHYSSSSNKQHTAIYTDEDNKSLGAAEVTLVARQHKQLPRQRSSGLRPVMSCAATCGSSLPQQQQQQRPASSNHQRQPPDADHHHNQQQHHNCPGSAPPLDHSPNIGPHQHQQQRQSLAANPGTTGSPGNYQLTSGPQPPPHLAMPTSASIRSAHLQLAAGNSAFDGISLPAISSHRTNSPWMRISSIILTPIGIVIILFIVVSPLLHYLM